MWKKGVHTKTKKVRKMNAAYKNIVNWKNSTHIQRYMHSSRNGV
jgi:hypothetical protein